KKKKKKSCPHQLYDVSLQTRKLMTTRKQARLRKEGKLKELEDMKNRREARIKRMDRQRADKAIFEHVLVEQIMKSMEENKILPSQTNATTGAPQVTVEEEERADDVVVIEDDNQSQPEPTTRTTATMTNPEIRTKTNSTATSTSNKLDKPDESDIPNDLSSYLYIMAPKAAISKSEIRIKHSHFNKNGTKDSNATATGSMLALDDSSNRSRSRTTTVQGSRKRAVSDQNSVEELLKSPSAFRVQQ
ncbi:hypothetical protein RFI_14461, partial [Reticulomyxa filosa]